MLKIDFSRNFLAHLSSSIALELTGAAEYGLRCYEIAQNKDLGFRQCTNFTLGCAFYDSYSKRFKELAKQNPDIFRYNLVDDQFQLTVSLGAECHNFFIGRVHAITRQFTGCKGKKNYLDEQLAASELYLPGLVEQRVVQGMHVIGIDFSPQNGIGKITLDYHAPVAKGCYNVLTIATLYDSEALTPVFSSAPAKIVRTNLAQTSGGVKKQPKAKLKHIPDLNKQKK